MAPRRRLSLNVIAVRKLIAALGLGTDGAELREEDARTRSVNENGRVRGRIS